MSAKQEAGQEQEAVCVVRRRRASSSRQKKKNNIADAAEDKLSWLRHDRQKQATCLAHTSGIKTLCSSAACLCLLY
jgi:flagellar motility protein MotE (MotC chaperone)